jgi:anti-sigma factor RsiW
MVGNGNHPLNRPHYDEATLHKYALGHLLPDEEERLRQHLDVCPLCRAAVIDIQSFCQRLSFGLHQELDNAKPGLQLSFDRIEWRKPPFLGPFLFRLQLFAPRALLILLLILLVAAIRLLLSSD